MHDDSDQKKVEEPPRRLLTDDEAGELLAKAYVREGGGVDEIAKERVWRRLNVREVRPKRPWWAVVSALAAAALAVVAVKAGVFQQELERSKGGGPAPISAPIWLETWTIGASGALEPVAASSALSGQNIVFKVHGASAGFFRLVLSEDGLSPHASAAEVAALSTSSAIVMSGREIYGYRIEAGHHAEICAVAGETIAAVEAAVNNLESTLQGLDRKACVSW